jgi:hypothetical protein
MTNLKQEILELIKTQPGIKAVDMATSLIKKCLEKERFETDTIFMDIRDEIGELIHNGKVVEIEYVLKDMDYRIKSIYFLKGVTQEIIDNRIAEIRKTQGDLELCTAHVTSVGQK